MGAHTSRSVTEHAGRPVAAALFRAEVFTFLLDFRAPAHQFLRQLWRREAVIHRSSVPGRRHLDRRHLHGVILALTVRVAWRRHPVAQGGRRRRRWRSLLVSDCLEEALQIHRRYFRDSHVAGVAIVVHHVLRHGPAVQTRRVLVMLLLLLLGRRSLLMVVVVAAAIVTSHVHILLVRLVLLLILVVRRVRVVMVMWLASQLRDATGAI